MITSIMSGRRVLYVIHPRNRSSYSRSMLSISSYFSANPIKIWGASPLQDPTSLKRVRCHHFSISNLSFGCSPMTATQTSTVRCHWLSTVSDSNTATNSHPIQLVNGGKELILSIGGGTQTTRVNATWLRHNCQCPDCVFSSGQKVIDPTALLPSLTVKAANLSGEG